MYDLVLSIPVPVSMLQAAGDIFRVVSCSRSLALGEEIMPLVGAEVAIQQVRAFRKVWFPGRFSAGKSALAFAFAYELGRRYGYRIVSNQSCIWNEQEPLDWVYDDFGNMSLKAIFIADEGGIHFRDNRSIDFLNYAGKMDIILMMPSAEEPAAAMRVLQIQPAWTLRPTGFPYNHFHWRVRLGSANYEGGFGWLGMEEIYGVYSTLNPSFEADAIASYLYDKAQEYKDYYYSRQSLPSWLEDYAWKRQHDRDHQNAIIQEAKQAKRVGEMDIQRRQVELLERSLAQAEEQAFVNETLSVRKAGGRRR
jgi:hypothetical protein